MHPEMPNLSGSGALFQGSHVWGHFSSTGRGVTKFPSRTRARSCSPRLLEAGEPSGHLCDGPWPMGSKHSGKGYAMQSSCTPAPPGKGWLSDLCSGAWPREEEGHSHIFIVIRKQAPD